VKPNKPKIDVVLTDAGRAALLTEPIGLLISDSSMFNCTTVQQDGAFLNMKVADPTGRIKTIIDVSIPLHFVLYMVSADAGTALGFKGNLG